MRRHPSLRPLMSGFREPLPTSTDAVVPSDSLNSPRQPVEDIFSSTSSLSTPNVLTPPGLVSPRFSPELTLSPVPLRRVTPIVRRRLLEPMDHTITQNSLSPVKESELTSTMPLTPSSQMDGTQSSITTPPHCASILKALKSSSPPMNVDPEPFEDVLTCSSCGVLQGWVRLPSRISIHHLCIDCLFPPVETDCGGTDTWEKTLSY